MSEPFTASAILTLIVTGASTRFGQTVIDEIGKFISGIRLKDPATATAIEKAQTTQLTEVEAKELISNIEDILAKDYELQQAVQSIETVIKSQPGAVANLTKLAEKIGVVNQGAIVNQTNHFSL